MKRLLFVALLSLPIVLADSRKSHAQCYAPGGNCNGGLLGLPFGVNAHPHFPPFGCGGFCMGFLSKIHFHGPLYNYGPYAGYYPFEPYGPWTSDLRYNPPSYGHAKHHLGLREKLGSWGHYAVSTLKNVFHRVHPLANRCGGGLQLGKCGTCGNVTNGTAPCCGTSTVALNASPTHTGQIGSTENSSPTATIPSIMPSAGQPTPVSLPVSTSLAPVVPLEKKK